MPPWNAPKTKVCVIVNHNRGIVLIFDPRCSFGRYIFHFIHVRDLRDLTEFRLSVQRLRTLQQKKEAQAKATRRDIATVLERGKVETARIKVEARTHFMTRVNAAAKQLIVGLSHS